MWRFFTYNTAYFSFFSKHYDFTSWNGLLISACNTSKIHKTFLAYISNLKPHFIGMSCNHYSKPFFFLACPHVKITNSICFYQTIFDHIFLK